MSKGFKPLEFLGSEKEISKICSATAVTLEREFKLKISQEVVIPPMVDCFIDAAVYESLQLAKGEVRSELNLFNLLRIVHELMPSEEAPELMTIITLGRMGMRKLELELNEDENSDDTVLNKMVDIDIKLLEKISIRASQYLEDRHHLYIRDYQIIFKVAEVFFDELLAYIKVNTLSDDTLTIFDQFTIMLDETGKFESIELTDYLQNTINSIYESVMMEIDRLEEEDNAFAENKTK